MVNLITSYDEGGARFSFPISVASGRCNPMRISLCKRVPLSPNIELYFRRSLLIAGYLPLKNLVGQPLLYFCLFFPPMVSIPQSNPKMRARGTTVGGGDVCRVQKINFKLFVSDISPRSVKP